MSGNAWIPSIFSRVISTLVFAMLVGWSVSRMDYFKKHSLAVFPIQTYLFFSRARNSKTLKNNVFFFASLPLPKCLTFLSPPPPIRLRVGKPCIRPCFLIDTESKSEGMQKTSVLMKEPSESRWLYRRNEIVDDGKRQFLLVATIHWGFLSRAAVLFSQKHSKHHCKDLMALVTSDHFIHFQFVTLIF